MPAYIELKKIILDIFKDYYEECIDKYPLLTETEEIAMQVRLIEKHLYTASFGNAKRQEVGSQFDLRFLCG